MQTITTRFRNISILAIVFTFLLGMMLTMDVQAAPTPASTVAPASVACDVSGAGPVTRGEQRTVQGTDGQVPLFDTPESPIIRFPVPSGTAVQVVDGAPVAGQCWYLVELIGTAGQGWVPAEVLAIEG